MAYHLKTEAPEVMIHFALHMFLENKNSRTLKSFTKSKDKEAHFLIKKKKGGGV